MHTSIGKYIIITGILLVVIGGIIYLFGDKFGWLGHLPGDIRIEKGNTRIFIPVVTMILVSIILTLLVNIIRKLF